MRRGRCVVEMTCAAQRFTASADGGLAFKSFGIDKAVLFCVVHLPPWHDGKVDYFLVALNRERRPKKLGRRSRETDPLRA